MNATFEMLAAVTAMAKKLGDADGVLEDGEIKPLFDFLATFPSIDAEMMREMTSHALDMDDLEAISLISKFDDDGKQQVANLFAQVVCRDEVLEKEEKSLYWRIADLCGLPEPNYDAVNSSEETSEPEEPETGTDEDSEAIIPAYLLVNYHGIVSVCQSENEDWSDLGGELASWIGADGVQVVRYTPVLNRLSEELNLNQRHLVFLMARNGYGDKTVGDNMPATILYGGGYPLYGNIVLALETDNGYEIEGIRTRGLLQEVFDKVDEAVGGLMRTE